LVIKRRGALQAETRERRLYFTFSKRRMMERVSTISIDKRLLWRCSDRDLNREEGCPSKSKRKIYLILIS